jgi:3-deoxy-D-manno-octulosonic-acid transferase
MRGLYSFLLYLLLPLVLLYLFVLGIRNRGYRRRWGERLGRFDPPERSGGIVVHAASVGEVNAASALVKEILARHPDLPLCMTTFTPTGSERARSLFGRQIFHVYAPLDLPAAVRRFYDRLNPRLLIVMETEIWPNFYLEASARRIPILIANARISDHSVDRYRRLRGLIAPALAQVSRIGAQTSKDAERMALLGAEQGRISVTGNLKFDVSVPASLAEQGEVIRSAWGTDRLVLTAGSTHEGDEAALFESFRAILADFPSALLVLVPRHPERFGAAAQAARAAGLEVSLRSQGPTCRRSTQCFVIDSMGELLRYYAAGDVAFVGGSIEPVGGHNVLEPAALAKAVLVGPHTFNFAEITQQMVDAGAARRVRDSAGLESALRELFSGADLRDRMGHRGRELVSAGQGAVDRTLGLLSELLTREAD